MNKILLNSTLSKIRHLSTYHNKWYSDGAFLSILQSRLNFPDSITKDKLNNLLSRHVIDFDCTTNPNTYQLFRRTHYPSNHARFYCYFICSNEQETPPGDINWSHSINYNIIQTHMTRSNTKFDRCN